MFDPEQAIGEEIDGRYVLCEVLGEGSYGVVFSAEERSVGEAVGSVALKLMRPKGAAEREAVVREVRAMAGLSHPNLVAYRSSGEVGSGPLKGCLYLATELAEGSLADELLLKGKLPEEEVRALARDLASALEYLHSQKAVHRDVKPANVLRCGSVWKLADFGLVRGFSGTQVSASGSKGTALYMSPEAVQGQTGPHVDVWALGVVLQQAASGTLAYSGGSEAELIAGLLAKEPTIAAGLPGWLEALVRACLDKERSKRPPAKDVPRMLAASPTQSVRVVSPASQKEPPAEEVSREFAEIVAKKLGIEPERVTRRFLSGLQELSLWGTQMTGAGLAHLKGLAGLQTLELGDTRVTDAGLAHLQGLTGLQKLWLSNTRVTDAGLAHLQGLIGLQWLNLRNTQVTGAGLEHLKGLTGLQKLWLSNTRVTDAGLAHLRGLTGLQSLSLQGTQVTDAGLAHLKGLAGLQRLSLQDTQATDSGLAHLKKALPHCTVVK